MKIIDDAYKCRRTLSFEIFTQNYLTYMVTPVQNMLKHYVPEVNSVESI